VGSNPTLSSSLRPSELRLAAPLNKAEQKRLKSMREDCPA
jgi:hypothetical protein